MRELISEYLSSIRAVDELLHAKFGQVDLLRAWRSGAIPRDGWLDPSRSVRYSFHGVGCTVESGKEVLNFDFGPQGRLDGFDLWRLRQFLESRVKRYPDLKTVGEQQRAFNKLKDLGEIVRSDELPSPHLFRLRRDA